MGLISRGTLKKGRHFEALGMALGEALKVGLAVLYSECGALVKLYTP